MSVTRNFLRRTALVLGVVSSLPPAVSTAQPQRTTVLISDLHMGLGVDDDGHWYRTEDFRWAKALAAFLEHVSVTGNDAVDLVVIGDFLELWQPPAGVDCVGPDADYGCSLAEIETTLRAVLKAHEHELGSLAAFARTGSNCLHVVPGNHDAALVVDAMWTLLAESLGADAGCVHRAENGTWQSSDGRIVAEHGHQIGRDPNRYDEWPHITKTIDGATYLRRPWGEQFVQELFNDAEAEYPLIDNLSPLSAGVKYRVKDRGAIDSAWDLARLLKFNLSETSLSQKLAILGESTGDAQNDEPPKWDIPRARALGADLFALTFADDDVIRELLEDDEEGAELRAALDRLARDEVELPDQLVLSLCDQLAIRESERMADAPPGSESTSRQCVVLQPDTLGSLYESTVSSRNRIVEPYVATKWQELTAMRVFVYGHTHAFETEWKVPITSRVSVSVLNDGAFQRVVDDGRFRRRAATRGLEPAAALGELDLSTLPACYSFVRVTDSPETGLVSKVEAWYMEESELTGAVIDICDPRCADVGSGCP